jgi:hypothetical protein
VATTFSSSSQKVLLSTQNVDYNSSVPLDSPLFVENENEETQFEDEYKKTAEAIMKSFSSDFLKPLTVTFERMRE